MTNLELAIDPTTITLTAQIESHLRRTEPWVRFLSFVAFAIAGLHIVAPLAVTAAFRDVSIILVYPALGILYLFPSLCLRRYATAIQRFRQTRDVTQLEAAVNAQRAFWKFTGVFVAVPVVIFVLAILAIIFSGVFSYFWK